MADIHIEPAGWTLSIGGAEVAYPSLEDVRAALAATAEREAKALGVRGRNALGGLYQETAGRGGDATATAELAMCPPWTVQAAELERTVTAFDRDTVILACQQLAQRLGRPVSVEDSLGLYTVDQVAEHLHGTARFTSDGGVLDLQEEGSRAFFSNEDMITYVRAVARDRGQTVRVDLDDNGTPYQLEIAPSGNIEEKRTMTETPMPPRPDIPPIATAPPQHPLAGPGPAEQEAGPQAPETSFLVDRRQEEAAKRGFRGVLNQMGMKLAPSSDELEQRRLIRKIAQHWPGSRTISVVNGKGGAGKTTDVIILSALFALFGGAGVVAWDNNETRGTLGWRTEKGPHDATVMDLLAYTEQLLSADAQASDLARLVHHQVTDKFDVLRSRPEVLSEKQRIDAEMFAEVHRVLSKYYRLVFVDSGNDESAERWQAMVQHTDQLVIATSTLEEEAETARLLLDELKTSSPKLNRLADRAVVIVSHKDRDEQAPDRIVQGFRARGCPTIAVPYDRGLRARPTYYGPLREETKRAYIQAAAAVAEGLSQE